MVKIFCGNVSDSATGADLRELFEKYGKVTEADVVEGKGFGFVVRFLFSILKHAFAFVKECARLFLNRNFNRLLMQMYKQNDHIYFFKHMEKDDESATAIAAINGTELKGRALNVEVRMVLIFRLIDLKKLVRRK